MILNTALVQTGDRGSNVHLNVPNHKSSEIKPYFSAQRPLINRVLLATCTKIILLVIYNGNAHTYGWRNILPHHSVRCCNVPDTNAIWWVTSGPIRLVAWWSMEHPRIGENPITGTGHSYKQGYSMWFSETISLAYMWIPYMDKDMVNDILWFFYPSRT